MDIKFIILFATNFILLILGGLACVMSYKSGIQLGLDLGKESKIKPNKGFKNPFKQEVNVDTSKGNDIDKAMQGFMNLMSYDGTPQPKEDEVK